MADFYDIKALLMESATGLTKQVQQVLEANINAMKSIATGSNNSTNENTIKPTITSNINSSSEVKSASDMVKTTPPASIIAGISITSETEAQKYYNDSIVRKEQAKQTKDASMMWLSDYNKNIKKTNAVTRKLLAQGKVINGSALATENYTRRYFEKAITTAQNSQAAMQDRVIAAQKAIAIANKAGDKKVSIKPAGPVVGIKPTDTNFFNKLDIGSDNQGQMINNFIKDFINGLSAAQQKSVTGRELQDRYKRVGKDIQSISGLGIGGRGTTVSKIADIQRAAMDQGYVASMRSIGDGRYQFAFTPAGQYKNASSVNWQKGFLPTMHIGEGGIINGRYNTVSPSTIFKTIDGEIKATPIIQTAESAQLDPLLRALKSGILTDKTHTPEQSTKWIQGLMNQAITGKVPSSGVSAINEKELSKEYYNKFFDASQGFTGKHAKLLTNYNVGEYIKNTVIPNPKVQEAIKDYYKSNLVNAPYLANQFDPYNPSKSLVDTFSRIWSRAGAGKETIASSELADSQLFQYLWNHKDLQWFKSSAKAITSVLGNDTTGIGENSYLNGTRGVTSSNDNIALGNLNDRSQRSLDQSNYIKNFTKKALEIRKKSVGAGKRLPSEMFTGFKNAAIAATISGLNQNIQYDVPRYQTTPIATLSQTEYNTLMQEYLKTKTGSSLGGKFSLPYSSLTDAVIIGKSLAEATQSVRNEASKRIYSSGEINKELLKANGIDPSTLKGSYIPGEKINFNNMKFKGVDKLFRELGLSKGDKITGITATPGGGWKYSFDKIYNTTAGTKMVLDGIRASAIVNDDFMKFIQGNGGLIGRDLSLAQGIIGNQDWTSTRKMVPVFRGKLETFTQAAQALGMTPEKIIETISGTKLKDGATPYSTFKDIFTVKDRQLAYTPYTTNEGKILAEIKNNKSGKTVTKNPFTEDAVKSMINPDNFAAMAQNLMITAARANGIKNPEEAGMKYYNQLKDVIRLSVGQHDTYPSKKLTGFGNVSSENAVTDDEKMRYNRLQTLQRLGSMAVSGTTGETQKSIKKGINSLIEQQIQEDKNLPKSVKDARAQIEQFRESYRSFGKNYISSNPNQDVILTTKEILGNTKPASNQIVIDSGNYLTNFDDKRKEGYVSTKDYSNFVMSAARNMIAQLGERGNIVLDTGNQKILLPNQLPSKNASGNIMPSQGDDFTAKILKGVLGDQYKFEENIKEVGREIVNTTEDKNSALVRSASHHPKGGSIMAPITGIDSFKISENDSGKDANTLQMSPGTYRTLNSTEKGSTISDVRKNIKRLFNEYKIRSNEEFKKLTPDQLAKIGSTSKGKLIDLKGKNIDELKRIEQNLIGRQISSILNGNSNYVAELERYPLNRWTEGGYTRIGLNSSLGNTLRISEGLAALKGGDFDGDQLRARILARTKYGANEFKAEQALLKFGDAQALFRNQLITAKNSGSVLPKDDIARQEKINNLAKQISKDVSTGSSYFGSQAAKETFAEVGLLSNMAKNFRMSLATDNVGYVNNTNAFASGNIGNTIKSDIAGAFMQFLEQDAISSKKIYGRLAERGITGEQASAQVSTLANHLANGNLSEAIKLSNQMGMTKDFFSSGIFDDLRSRWSGYSTIGNQDWGKAFSNTLNSLLGVKGNAGINWMDPSSLINITGDQGLKALNTVFKEIGTYASKRLNYTQNGEGIKLAFQDMMKYSRVIDPYQDSKGEARGSKIYFNPMTSGFSPGEIINMGANGGIKAPLYTIYGGGGNEVIPPSSAGMVGSNGSGNITGGSGSIQSVLENALTGPITINTSGGLTANVAGNATVSASSSATSTTSTINKNSEESANKTVIPKGKEEFKDSKTQGATKKDGLGSKYIAAQPIKGQPAFSEEAWGGISGVLSGRYFSTDMGNLDRVTSLLGVDQRNVRPELREGTSQFINAQIRATEGSYAHKISEILGYSGKSSMSELNPKETTQVQEARNQILGSLGLGYTSNNNTLARLDTRGEGLAKLAREHGFTNEKGSWTQREVRFAGGFTGEDGKIVKAVSGQADLLNHTKGVGVTVGDYKFSNDTSVATLGERILQGASYLYMEEEQIRQALENLKNQKKTKSQQKDISTLTNKLRDFQSGRYVKIFQSIQQGDETLNKVVTARITDQEFAGKYLQAAQNLKTAEDKVKTLNAQLTSAQKYGQPTQKIQNELAAAQIALNEAKNAYGAIIAQAQDKGFYQVTGTQYYDASGKKMPRGVGEQKEQSITSKSSPGNKEVNSYLKQQAAINKAELDAQKFAMMGQGKTGTQASQYQQLAQAANMRVNALKSQLPILDLENKTLNGQVLTTEQLTKLQSGLNNLALKHAVNQSKVTATMTQQQGVFGKLFTNFKSQMGWMINSSLVYGAIGKIRQAITAVISTIASLDKALVNIQIATGKTRSETHDLLMEYQALGNDLGRTTEEVATASNDWLRAGFKGEEATQLTRASMELSTLGMIESSQATEHLISTLKGWNLSAKEVTQVVDKLTAVDMAAAISAGDLASAMSRANNVARISGSSMDNFIGYVTTVADVTQKTPETVGESFKTVYSRLGNVKAGKFVATQADQNSEGFSEDNFEALNDIEKVLHTVGISLRKTPTSWKNADEVMSDIGEHWNDWDQTTQNAVTTAVAGTRQRENVVTLFENWDQVSKYADIAANSYGTAAEKMKAYSDSVAAAKERVKNALEEWVLSFDGSEFFKKFYSDFAIVLRNLKTFGIVLGGIIMALKGDAIIARFAGGLANLFGTAMKLNNAFTGTIAALGGGRAGIQNGWNNFKQNINDRRIAIDQANYSKNLASRSGLTGTALLGAQGFQSGLLTMSSNAKTTVGSLMQTGVMPQLKTGEMETLLRDKIQEQIDFIDKEIAEKSKNIEALAKNTSSIQKDTEVKGRSSVATMSETEKIEASINALNQRKEALIFNLQALDGETTAISEESKVSLERAASELRSMDATDIQTLATNLLAAAEEDGTIIFNDLIMATLREIATSEDLTTIEGDVEKNSIILAQALAQYVEKLGVSGSRLMGSNLEKSGNAQTPSMIGGGVLSMAGMLGGSKAGKGFASVFGADPNGEGGMTGSMIGGIAGMAVGSGLMKAIPAMKTAGLAGAAEAVGGLIPGIGLAVGTLGIIAGVVKNIHDENKKERQEAAATQFQESNESLTKKETAQVQIEKYKELSKGVDSNGKNVTLSDDEYKDFLEISNKLAEAFPELIVKVDEAGNSFIGLNGVVQDVSNAIEEATEAQKRKTALDLLDPDLLEKEVEETEEKAEEAKNTRDTANRALDNFSTEEVTEENFHAMRNVVLPWDEQLFNNLQNQGFTVVGSEDKEEMMVQLAPGSTASDPYEGKNKEDYLSDLTLERQRLKGVLESEGITADANYNAYTSQFSPQYEAIYQTSSDEQVQNIYNNGNEAEQDYIKNIFKNSEWDYTKLKTDLPGVKATVNDTVKKADKLYNSTIDINGDEEGGEVSFSEEYNKGKDDYATLGEYQNARDAIFQAMVDEFKEGGYTEDEKAIIRGAGFTFLEGAKAPTDEEDWKSRFEELGVKEQDDYNKENAEDLNKLNWNNISLLPPEQGEKVYEWLKEGTITKDSSMNSVNNLLDMDSSTATNYKEAKKIVDNRVSKQDDLETDLDKLKNEYGDATKIKEFSKKTDEEIIEEYSKYGATVVKSLLECRDQIKGGTKEAAEDFNKGLEDIDKAYKAETLQSQIKASEKAQTEMIGVDTSKIDGHVDTWSELASVLNDVAAAYKAVDEAQKDQAKRGKLTWKTALDLLSADENYIQLMEVKNGKLQLVSNAEEVLRQIQEQKFKTMLRTMLAEHQERIEQLKTELVIAETTDEIQANIEAQQAYWNTLEKTGKEAMAAAAKQAAYNKALEGGNAAEIQKEIDNLEKSDKIINDMLSKGISADILKDEGYDVEATGNKAISKLEKIKDLLDAINQEFYQMRAFIKNINESSFLNKTYFAIEKTYLSKEKNIVKKALNKMGLKNLDEPAKVFKKIMGFNSTGNYKNDKSKFEYAIEMYKDYQEAYVNWKNIDDESIQFEIDLLSARGESSEKLIEAYKKLLKASDNQTEKLERQKQLIDEINNYYSQEIDKANIWGEVTDNSIELANQRVKKLQEEKATTYEILQAQKELVELQKQQIEDKISILNTRGVNGELVISQLNEEMKLAQTDKERVEIQSRINEEIKKQRDLAKQLLQFQREIVDTLIQYENSTPWTERYQELADRKETILRQEYENAKESAQMYRDMAYENIYKSYREAGYSEAIAKEKAYSESEKDSNYQEAQKGVTTAFQSLGEFIVKQFQDQVDAIQRKIDDLEKSKANEWGSDWDEESNKVARSALDKINNYYSAMNELQEAIKQQAYDVISSTDYLTDEQVDELVDKYNDAIKQIHDNAIQQAEDIKEYQESVYSASTNEVQRYIDQLNKQKEIISDQYDEEIKKLKDKQQSIERTNTLLEKQKTLQNSVKEKERVYREGIGWVYESNREKVKEAQKDLDNFKLNDSITDLENAKNRELELLNERIEDWQDYLEMLETKYKEYERLEEDKLLMELLGVSSEREVHDLLLSDMNTFTEYATNNTQIFLENQTQAYSDFSTVFNDFLSDYADNNKLLGKLRKESIEILSDEEYYRALANNGKELGDYLNTSYVPSFEQEAQEVYDIDPTTLYGIDPTTGASYSYVEGASELERNRLQHLASAQLRFAEGATSMTITLADGTKYTAQTLEEAESFIKNINQMITKMTQKGSQSMSIIPNYTNWSIDSYSGEITRVNPNVLVYKTIEAAQTEFDALGQGDIIVNSNNLKKSKNKKNKKISIDKNNQAHVQSTEGLAIANALLANADIDSGGNGYGTQAAIKAVNKMLINKGLVDSKTGKIIDDKARETINNLKLDQKYIDQFNGKADGILSGAIDYTGLTMLHGNPTHPEYVLNSDQAYTLLYNLSTKKLIPESNTDKKCGDTIYQFQGGITMNGVNDPEEFFKELTQAMGNRFNVTKNK